MVEYASTLEVPWQAFKPNRSHQRQKKDVSCSHKNKQAQQTWIERRIGVDRNPHSG